MHRELDFLIIGAQKGGTTALFRYLQHHPDLYLPPEKEAPFFSHPERLAQGPEYLFERWFSDAPDRARLGKATPHYMTHPEIPARIAEVFPRIKLVALLRHPVDRAHSHHQMMTRRGSERRSFDEAVREQLDAEVLARARVSTSPLDTYVAWGEYGRILGNYLDHFPPDQLLIEFTETLAAEPSAVVARVHRFLGVEHRQPANLGERYHVGGAKPRVPNPVDRLKRVPAVRRAWESLPPRVARPVERGLYWFEQWNVEGEPDAGPEISAETRKLLSAHYLPDTRLVGRLVGDPPPWDLQAGA
jgi:hypothetical protein